MPPPVIPANAGIHLYRHLRLLHFVDRARPSARRAWRGQGAGLRGASTTMDAQPPLGARNIRAVAVTEVRCLQRRRVDEAAFLLHGGRSDLVNSMPEPARTPARL